jgi:methylglyoxal synthase
VAINDIDTEPGRQRRIALVAHDGRKQDMREWAEFNRDLLAGHKLYATGTTGRMLSEELGLPVTRFHSGPFGGDQQVGARIADGGIDVLVFFWDPMEPHPMTTTSRRCCEWRCCGTSRSPVTGPPRISSSLRH